MPATEPADEMREIINDFIVESKETLENLDRKYIELEKSPEDPDLLNSIFRAVHTIKGASGFLGFDQVVDVSHKAESVLNKLRQKELLLSPAITGALLKAFDMIKVLIGHIEAEDGLREDISGQVKALEDILSPPAEAPGTDGGKKMVGEILVDEGVITEDTLAEALDIQARQPQKIGEILVEKGMAGQDEVKKALDKQGGQAASGAPGEQTIRVDIKRLDNVLNLVGELVLGRNRLARLAAILEERYADDESVAALTETNSFMDLITTDLQVAVMKTRMQPIKKVFNRFPRMVWDLAHGRGKEVEFTVIGEDTELDKSVIEEIGDPLVHLLRNSVDHGLEPPDDRRAAGKPAMGSLRLSAAYEGNHVVITLEDDGRGMDLDAIKDKAVKNGAITPQDAERMSDREVLDLAFLPGLSTAKAVSDVSGRGVGMDVVKSNITKLKGAVNIETSKGRGTKVSIRLPLTVAILQALMVRVCGEIFAIPLSAVAEIIRVSHDDIKTLNGKEVINKRGMALSLVRLDDEFHLRRTEAEDVWMYVVVLAMGDRSVGLLVDEIKGQEDVVIKSIGDTRSQARGIAGATITGDGKVVLTLDIEVLVKDMISEFEGAHCAR